MLSSTMQDALNAQINKEQYSSQLYLAMSAHLDDPQLQGVRPLAADPGRRRRPPTP